MLEQLLHLLISFFQVRAIEGHYELWRLTALRRELPHFLCGKTELHKVSRSIFVSEN